MTRCEELDLSLTAYVDRELAAPVAAEVEAHLAGCLACAIKVERERRVRAAVRDEFGDLRAPARLRSDLHAALVAASAARPARSERTMRWLGLAATLALAVLGGRQWGVWDAGRDRSAPPAGQVLAAHLRSLQPGHLVDVESSEHHAVKPWFAGRLDYSPPVPELDSLGFILKGGRLDYVLGRPTAALVYGRRLHLINLFTWPGATADVPPQAEPLRGYNTVHGAAGGFSYWAVSDLNPTELTQFARLVERSLAPTAGGR
jgi:anti-sigma factor RsiW